ncbi:UNVERIFIED_ORG: hypothetical protein ABIB19_002739 [Arthrobacter sp. UYEF10]
MAPRSVCQHAAFLASSTVVDIFSFIAPDDAYLDLDDCAVGDDGVLAADIDDGGAGWHDRDVAEGRARDDPFGADALYGCHAGPARCTTATGKST